MLASDLIRIVLGMMCGYIALSEAHRFLFEEGDGDDGEEERDAAEGRCVDRRGSRDA